MYITLFFRKNILGMMEGVVIFDAKQVEMTKIEQTILNLRIYEGRWGVSQHPSRDCGINSQEKGLALYLTVQNKLFTVAIKFWRED